MFRSSVSIGVDLGGTFLRVLAVDESGKVRHSHKGPAPAPAGLPRALRALWKRWKIPRPRRLIVGSKGVWTPAERRALQGRLRGLAEAVHALSDVELALEGALTPSGQPLGRASGVLILAGTGSIALGKNKAGHLARAGGLGPEKGDEGSGLWIGREYQRHFPSKKRASALAPLVLRGKDPVRRDIVRRAQDHLADLVLQAAGRVRMKKPIPVTWAGGLFEDSGFRRDFQRVLKRKGGQKFLWTRPHQSAVQAAALWSDYKAPKRVPPR